MVEGATKTGCFGFCDIRQFTDVTECLQGDVMLFVNSNAEIVHRATHKCVTHASRLLGLRLDLRLIRFMWQVHWRSEQEHWRRFLVGVDT